MLKEKGINLSPNSFISAMPNLTVDTCFWINALLQLTCALNFFMKCNDYIIDFPIESSV